MTSSSPLNPHLQDAVAGHNAKSGIGPLQHAAGIPLAEHVLIARGYVPVRQLMGTVAGVWGEAHIRLQDGQVRPLQVGDVIRKGDVVLTSQDGIVQLQAHAKTLLAGNGAGDDVERIITQVGRGDAEVVPAAGGGADGSLSEGLRVGRDSESVTAAAPLHFGAVAGAVVASQGQAGGPLASPPVANPDAESTAANTPVVFDPRSNDTSTTAVTIVAVAGHAITPNTPVTLPQGTVAMNPDGTLVFTPGAGVSGSVTFTYTERNGSSGTATSTVTIVVAGPVDHAPVAVSDAFSGTEDHAITGSLAGNDTPSADGGNTWSLASGAAHGSVTVNPDGTFSYVPAAHYSGADSFTYTITDANGSTSSASVTLAVAPVPAAVPDTATVAENASVSGSLAANDTASADGSSAWALAGNASHGSVVVNADGSYTYTPTAGFHGSDSFAYTVTDAAGSSSTATVTLTVTPIAPVATSDTLSAHENTPVTGSLAGNDTPVAGETNAWSVAADPSHGTLTPAADFATSGNFTYTPDAGFSGVDTFTYTITDGSGHASTATVTIDVAAIAPVAAADGFGATENATTGTLSVAANDAPVAGESNTWSLPSTATANGAITPAADFATTGNFTYTPNAGFHGADTFSYVVTDGSGQSSTATVTINVAAIDPVATADTFGATENATTGTLNLGSNDTAVAGEASTWSVASTTTTGGGTITPAADFATSGKFAYTPNAGFSGVDTFTYTITDSSGHASTATVTLNVAAINPSAAADTFSATENSTTGTLNLASNDTAVAGEANTWSLTSTTTAHGGTITPAADFATSGKFTYTPNGGFLGADTFTYTITDGSGHASTATVTVNVTAINPAAAADTFSATENATTGTLNLASNDTPVAGEASTWSISSTTTTGGGTITPAADFATSG
ncbi:MAG TPA: Ig-like domain-containing protein, partial [Burkholderiaceae bacterium]|nr:Ig-like domain-containing protein [Burkholderiaceae bacterium]